METKDIIKQRRKELGLTQQDIADVVGVSKPTVNRWENGGIDNIGSRKLSKLAKALKTTAEHLIAPDIVENAIPYTQGLPVRVVGTVKCGYGSVAFEDFDGFEYADVKCPDEYIYLKVKGDSMEPRICDGDLALVHLQPDVECGELGVIIINGDEGTLKKIIKQNGSLILQAFNPAYLPKIISGEQLNETRIVGKVVETKTKW